MKTKSFIFGSILFVAASVLVHGIKTNAYSDFVKVTGVSNPGSGIGRTFIDSVTNTFTCLNSDGSSCAPTGGGGGTTRGVFASRPSCGGGNSGALYLATDAPGIWSQCNGSSWQDFFQSTAVTLPGAASGFTVVNGGTLTDAHGTVLFTVQQDHLTVAVKALSDPSTAWDVQLAVKLYVVDSLDQSDLPECGVFVTTGTVAGSSNAYGTTYANTETSNRSYQIENRKYEPINGTITGISASSTIPVDMLSSDVRWVRITGAGGSGGTLTFYAGDGETWTQVGTTSTPSGTITHFGVGCDSRGTTAVIRNKIVSMNAP